MKRILKMFLSAALIFSLLCPSFSALTYAEGGGDRLAAQRSIIDTMATTFPTWACNQLYTRLLTTAGSVLVKGAAASENETFQEVASILNKLVFGGNDTGSELAEIKEMCSMILEETEEINEYLHASSADISSTLAAQNMRDVYEKYENAWENEVELPMRSAAAPNYYLAHGAYKEYLKYSESYANGTTLTELGRSATKDEVLGKRKTLFTQFTLMSKKRNDDITLSDEEFYKNAIFNSDDIDNQIYSVLEALLDNMYAKTSSGSKLRFVDTAAQVAYCSLPYSTEQARFVDTAIKRQLDEVSIVILVYQEFLAQRAEYFTELYESKKTELDSKELEEYASTLNDYYIARQNKLAGIYSKNALHGGITGVIEAWLTREIYLEGSLTGGYIYLDSYVREDMTDKTVLEITDDTFLNQTDWTFYYNEAKKGNLDSTLVTHYEQSGVRRDEVSKNGFVGKRVPFRREGVVVARENAAAAVVPIYVLDSDSGAENFYMKKFDFNYENAFGLNDLHVPSVDYYNLVGATYTDGINTYKCISSTAQLRDVIANNYYAYLKNSPYAYLAPMLSESTYGNRPIFLLLNTPTKDSSASIHTRYAVFGTLDISNGKTYTSGENWAVTSVDQYNLQDDRKSDENKTNYMYSAMLLGEDSFRSKITALVNGSTDCKVTYAADDNYTASDVDIEVLNDNTITANAGTAVTIDLSLPSCRSVKKIVIRNYRDADMTAFVNESVILDDTMTGYTEYFGTDEKLRVRVPYANAQIVITTECEEYDNGFCHSCNSCEAPELVSEDGKSYYEISNAGQLYWFSALTNGDGTNATFTEKNASANARLVCEIDMSYAPHIWIPIGNSAEGYGGEFDGNGYCVYDLNRNMNIDNECRGGLFGVLAKTASVYDLIVDNATVFPKNTPVVGAGVIAKQNYGSIQTTLVRNSSVQLGNWAYLGGIVGVNHKDAVIINCAVVNTDITRRYGASSSGTMGGICEVNKGVLHHNHTYNCRFNNGVKANNGAIIASAGKDSTTYFNYYYTASEVSNTFGTSKTVREFEATGDVLFLLGRVNSECWVQPDEYEYPVPVLERLNNCHVTYVTYGGEHDNSSDIKTDETYILHPASRRGYDFEGWYTEDTYERRYASLTPNQRKLTLYAKWSLSEYEIQYVLNGGENVSANPISYNMLDEDIVLSSPSRNGYEFVGWSADPDGTLIMTSIEKGTVGNITLYANWKKINVLTQKDGAYLITSYDDLVTMSALVQREPSKYAGAKYIQTVNIACGMRAWEKSIGDDTVPFVGEYDGGGNYIVGLRPTKYVAGLFGVVGATGRIKNVHISDFDYDKTAEYAAGLVGKNYGEITGSTSGVNLTVSIFIERENGEKVPVSEMNTTIRGELVAGGLAAYNYGTIKNCANKAEVYITSVGLESYAGGIVGKNYGEIINSYNTGTVEGAAYAGGIAGVHATDEDDGFSLIKIAYNSGCVSGIHNGGAVGICNNKSIENTFYLSSNRTGIYGVDEDPNGVSAMDEESMKNDAFLNTLNELVSGTELYHWERKANLNGGFPKFAKDTSETKMITSVRRGDFGPTVEISQSPSTSQSIIPVCSVTFIALSSAVFIYTKKRRRIAK